MNISKQIKKGQILIIVLVTMMVLGIILVSTTSILIKDSQISQSTNKYEELNTYAEKMAFQLGLQYANPQKRNLNISIYASEPETSKMNTDISNLFETIGWKTVNSCIIDPTIENCYECNIAFDESISGKFTDEDLNTDLSNPSNVKAIARICDSYSIKNAELFKDELLVFNLSGVSTNTIESKTYQISWESNEKLKNIGIEVSVDFSYKARGIENYGTIKSIYKPISSNEILNDLNLNNNKYISFTGTGDSFEFRLENFENSLKTTDGYFKHFSDDDFEITNYKQIRLRPIIKSVMPIAMKISMKTLEEPIEIVQGRSIEVTTYEQAEDIETETEGGFRGSQASIISTVPATKFSGLFDYVLKNETTTIL
ncbi:hypothetical protein KBD45_00570 [Candidatus Dojkabacteria bacterium]|nr:hypothetical protein [Candidatus Dojkabacteria bacterium]